MDLQKVIAPLGGTEFNFSKDGHIFLDSDPCNFKLGLPLVYVRTLPTMLFCLATNCLSISYVDFPTQIAIWENFYFTKFCNHVQFANFKAMNNFKTLGWIFPILLDVVGLQRVIAPLNDFIFSFRKVGHILLAVDACNFKLGLPGQSRNATDKAILLS